MKQEQADPKAKPKQKGVADPALQKRRGAKLEKPGTGEKKPPNILKPLRDWHSSLNTDIGKMKQMKQDCEETTSTMPEMIRQQYANILEQGLSKAIQLRSVCQSAIDGDRVVDDALRQELETAKTD